MAAYGMETCEYEVIRHNENITCKVVNDGKAYVLRIHQPIEGFCVSLIKDGKVLKNGTLVTLLSWVEGIPIKSEEGGKYAEELAKLACRIHNATKGFEGERIDYDNALCNRMVSEIRHAVELGHLSEKCAEKCIAEIHEWFWS